MRISNAQRLALRLIGLASLVISMTANAQMATTQPAAVAPHLMPEMDRPTGFGTGDPAKMIMAAEHPLFDVLTRSYNNARTGTNVHESQLNPLNLGGLHKLFALDVMAGDSHDDPRLEAQPLIVTRLRMNDGVIHNVVFVCTMANNVWAFDADSGTQIWKKPVNLGTPITPIPQDGWPGRSDIDLWGINIRWGILSTPVIDRAANCMYVTCWTSPDGKRQNSSFMLHKLDLANGSDQVPSVAIQGSVTVGNSTASFLPPFQKLRAALLLAPSLSSQAPVPTHAAALSGRHGTMAGMTDSHDESDESRPDPYVLIMACGMMGENNKDQHGWVMAFDPQTLRRTAIWCTTPTTFGGGIWQAGQGPAADDWGDIFFQTANGGFNGTSDFAESIVRLRYTPPATADSAGELKPVEHFTPFLDASRLRSEPGTGYSFQDQDLGSAGAVVPRGIPFVFGGGKDGVLYVLKRGAFGNTSLDDIRNHTQYNLLASSPVFFTYFPGFGVDPTNIEDLDHNYFGLTHHLHGSPVYFNSPDLGPMLFCWGENEHLRAWSVDRAGAVTYVAAGHETASEGTPGPLGGMPGGMLTLSANGKMPHSSVVWATVPLNGDGNHHVVEGVVRAYDATTFDMNQDGSKSLHLLWNSKQIPDNKFNYSKFCPPVVCNGKLYITTYDGRIDVYGL